MFTSKVLALENAQVSRYFTFLTCFNCAFARVVTNTVEDQTLDAIPAQCSGGEVPKSSLPLPSLALALAAGNKGLFLLPDAVHQPPPLQILP